MRLNHKAGQVTGDRCAHLRPFLQPDEVSWESHSPPVASVFPTVYRKGLHQILAPQSMVLINSISITLEEMQKLSSPPKPRVTEEESAFWQPPQVRHLYAKV